MSAVTSCRKTECTVEGCDRGGKIIRGCCSMHYSRLWRQGGLRLPSASERFAAKLVRRPNGCLEWTGASQPEGYGHMWFGGKWVGSHRIAWILANGPIPDGLHVLHHCDNPPCAQTDPTEGYPDGHLFLGTNAENVADRDAKDRGWASRAARDTA